MTLPWPLDGCTDADPLEGGYGFLDLTADGITPHPGLDLNAGPTAQADCGAAVRSPAAGVVRSITLWDGVTKGYGNHVWIEHDDGRWTHYCHLGSVSASVGARVAAGDVIGTCGNTGGWPFCHTHFEVTHTAPPAYDFWPKGYSRQAVQSIYADPKAWVAAVAQQEETTVDPNAQAIVDAALSRGLDSAQAVNDLCDWSGQIWADNQALAAQIASQSQQIQDLSAKIASPPPTVIKVVAPANVQVNVEPST